MSSLLGSFAARRLGRATVGIVPAAIAALALGAPASAGPDSTSSSAGVTSPALLALITNDDLFSTADLTVLLDPPGPAATQHYGPYASSSPDSGTCGNDWAQDAFDRHFTVRPDGAGGFTIVEQFKNGSFVTESGPSPGSCDVTDGSPPGTVDAGRSGSMHGYFIISGVGAQTSTSAYCDAVNETNDGCTTTTFVNTHFAPCYPATCTVTTFFDHYSAGDQQLAEHEWKNASPDRGGNHGDIRSTDLP
jgi:hypothetical protein